MNESPDEFLRHVAAELRRDAAYLPTIALIERLSVPLPEGNFDSIASAPGWVAARVDDCPDCMAHANTPALWSISGDTLVCAYRCRSLRWHAWWTSWGISSLGVEVAL